MNLFLRSFILSFLFSSFASAQVSNVEIEDVLSKVRNEYRGEIAALDIPFRISFLPDERSTEISIRSEWDEDVEARMGFFQLSIDNHYALMTGMTKDAFAMLVCHEFGHVLGGAPIYNLRATSFKNPPGFNKPISAEGQADYFASSKCFKRYALVEPARVAANEFVVRQCRLAFIEAKSRELCERSLVASENLLRSLALTRIAKGRAEKVPTFKSRNVETISKTLESHPSLDCRLQTFLAGALCSQPIESATSFSDSTSGYCETGLGARPACWFNANDYEHQ